MLHATVGGNLPNNWRPRRRHRREREPESAGPVDAVRSGADDPGTVPENSSRFRRERSVTSGRNVLFIVLDQLRADCMGSVSAAANSLNAAARMPNLDALRESAVGFDRHYTAISPCGPSRASLLTGLYAMTHHAVRN